MRLVVERDALAAALAAVNARACGKMTMPILECVLLDASESRLRILAHWLDACCSFEVAADVTDPGVHAVDADKLTGLVNGFQKGAQVSIASTDSQVEIRAGRSRYRLPALPPADFPDPLTSDDGAVRFSVPASDFSDLLGPPEIAMSSQATRPHLNGMFLHRTSEGLATCATDGFNLVRVQSDVRVPPFDPIILPRDRISDLQAHLDKGDVDLEICPRLFTITAGARRYTTKLIDGTFPPYEKVVPPINDNAIIVTRADLLAALQRLRVLLGEHNTIVLKWGDGAPTLTLAPHRGTEAADEEIEADGGSIAAGEFITPAVRLAELMSVMPYDEVKLTFTDSRTPMRIEGANNGDVLQLIMPMDFGQPKQAEAA
jgi:DNA polymerase-3 subunit beta